MDYETELARLSQGQGSNAALTPKEANQVQRDQAMSRIAEMAARRLPQGDRMANPQDLIQLLRGEFSSLTIGFNEDHACNYVNAQGWHDEYGFYGGGRDNDRITWASEDERLKAIRENSVWTIQWYPETPVGFVCVGASTFDAAAEFALTLKGA